MPGKTRRTRKYNNNKNKRPDRQTNPAITAERTEPAQVQKTVRSAESSVSAGSSAANKPGAVVHPYIARELWMTGILAVIMLVLLIILSMVF